MTIIALGAADAETIDKTLADQADYRFSYTAPSGLWGRQVYVLKLDGTNAAVEGLRVRHYVRIGEIIKRMEQMCEVLSEEREGAKKAFADLADQARAVGLHLDLTDGRAAKISTRDGETAEYSYGMEYVDYLRNLIARRELYPDLCRAWD